ncbi:MAG: hypothetical protein A4C66_02860 [Nitrospira sp. HN-bin3]|nr:MAG: hypothetical protein A4C66_02860 [Nitrospira sp. HN-bin3]
MMDMFGVFKVASALVVDGLCFYFLLRSDKHAKQVIDSWRDQGHIKDGEYHDALKKMAIRMRIGYGFLLTLALALTAIYLKQLLSEP